MYQGKGEGEYPQMFYASYRWEEWVIGDGRQLLIVGYERTTIDTEGVS